MKSSQISVIFKPLLVKVNQIKTHTHNMIPIFPQFLSLFLFVEDFFPLWL